MKTRWAWLLVLVLVTAGLLGCRCPRESGAREYRPGQGWTPVR
ncbi:hypothetical protein [Limisphaera ngatamarikiensis]|nr:hypothetical protein [Limisphaera ngatamarikiensis]